MNVSKWYGLSTSHVMKHLLGSLKYYDTGNDIQEGSD